MSATALRRHPERARASVDLARDCATLVLAAARRRLPRGALRGHRAPSASRSDGCARRAHRARSTGRRFAADVDACTACGLCRTRNQIGARRRRRRAEWLFVGEAPGAEEDARGEPFVGQAGTPARQHAGGARASTRDDNVYIANVLKCRPPDNRTPEPRRGRRVPALPRAADRAASRPQADRRARQERGVAAARDRRDDREPARPRAPLSRRAADRHLSSGLPAAQPAGQGEGVGGSAACPAHAARRAAVASRERTIRAPIRCAPLQRGRWPHSPRGSLRPPRSSGGTHDPQARRRCSPSSPRSSLAGCGYNTLQPQDEGIKAAWSEVLNQYQRRADLVPNLVNTVKGYAAQEDEGADRSHQRARERRRHQGDAGARQRSRRVPEVPAGAGRALERAVAPAGRRRELSATSSPTRCSATCSRSSKAPRTASPSRATATSRRVQDYNTTVRQFPTNLTAMIFKHGREAQLHRRERGGDQRAAEGRLRQAGRARRDRRTAGAARRAAAREEGARCDACRAQSSTPEAQLRRTPRRGACRRGYDRRIDAQARALLLAAGCSRCAALRAAGAWESGHRRPAAGSAAVARASPTSRSTLSRRRDSRRSKRSSPPGRARRATSSPC